MFLSIVDASSTCKSITIDHDTGNEAADSGRSSPTCVPEGGVREVREEGMGSLGRSYLSVKCNNI